MLIVDRVATGFWHQLLSMYSQAHLPLVPAKYVYLNSLSERAGSVSTFNFEIFELQSWKHRQTGSMAGWHQFFLVCVCAHACTNCGTCEKELLDTICMSRNIFILTSNALIFCRNQLVCLAYTYGIHVVLWNPEGFTTYHLILFSCSFG